MKITYDKVTNAVDVTFYNGKVSKTIEISKDVIVDLDRKKNVLSIEILGVKNIPVVVQLSKSSKT